MINMISTGFKNNPMNRVYNTYMIPAENDIIGLEEEQKKTKGLSEFSFNIEAMPTLPLMEMGEIKKKQELIIIQNDGRTNNKHRRVSTKGKGKTSELF